MNINEVQWDSKDNNYLNVCQLMKKILEDLQYELSKIECFVAGSMILTAMGLKAIETIQPGDQVIATNPDTFQTEEKKVIETYIHKTTCIVKIIIQNEVIYTTMNHPFYVKGQGFVAACKLSKGDEIMNASGGSYPVECVELEEKQEVVYNFQVEDYHTYYVGENSILVHNACPEGSGSNGNYEKADYHGDKNNTVKKKHQIKVKKLWIILLK